jgi:hypothetical protein
LKFTDIVYKIVKAFWILGVIGVFGIIGVMGYIFYQINVDHNFGSFEIPENLSHMKKPLEGFSKKVERDSIEFLKPETEKLLITGTGYNGYTFYYWHKPNRKGKIFIRGFESQREIELMEKELPRRTEKIIKQTKEKYEMYSSNTSIHEGTFFKYYPARFELWFESENGEEKIKLTEIEYLIDGWDH